MLGGVEKDLMLDIESASIRRPADDIFQPSIWGEPLQKFANAIGITISLYDHTLRRRNLVTSGPIGDRLSAAAFWDEKGLGTRVDRAAAELCLREERVISSVQLDMFSHLATPLTVGSEVMGVFVLGWIPERFADPVHCDHVAKQIGARSMEIWQLMRMQQPVSREKLESHGRMLETFALPLVKQLLLQIEDRVRATRARISAETAIAFAQAKSVAELCEALYRSIRGLTTTSGISIELIQMANETQRMIRYSDARQTTNPHVNTLSQRSNHITVPIPSAHGSALGKIEVSVEESELSDEVLSEIQTIAGQFGTSLQKVHLIEALENERSALHGANLQLQHLHKMKDEFLATVSHELRTPLNAILGWSQMLIDFGPAGVDWERAITTIERNAKNQARLIEDLLDVSRIISGKMILQRADLEATSLLTQSIETVRPMIDARRQKLHLQISPVPIPFKGDATRVTQIFWNLLSNASKFTPEGGDITVVLENAGHYFRLEITDSGKGIHPDFLPYLFDRFSQADQSHTRQHGGLGLGLAIVRHLVDLHGGTVMAKSQGEAKGSTFTVFLPQNATDLELDTAHSLSQVADAPSAREKISLEGIKILIIDDEPDSLRLTRFVLEKRGGDIRMADTAEEGFQILREWRPDVLVSDISMPGGNGYDLIRRIRALKKSEGGDTPAVALTAMAGREQKELALSSGFQLHVAKPFEPNVLYEGLLGLLKAKAGDAD